MPGTMARSEWVVAPPGALKICPSFRVTVWLAAARYQVGHGVLGSRGRLTLRGRCSLVGKHHE